MAEEINDILLTLIEIININEYLFLATRIFKDLQKKESTLRIYVRKNKLSDTLEILLHDISQIIEIETLKAQDK